jgi:hypothetical protein
MEMKDVYKAVLLAGAATAIGWVMKGSCDIQSGPARSIKDGVGMYDTRPIDDGTIGYASKLEDTLE